MSSDEDQPDRERPARTPLTGPLDLLESLEPSLAAELMSRSDRPAEPVRPGAYRHVIWDWNGTLFDDTWLYFETMNWLLGRYGLPLLTEARYLEVFTYPIRDYFIKAGFDLETHRFEDLGKAFLAEYARRRPECGLRSGAMEVLREVAGLGLTQSILSGFRHEDLLALLERFGLGGFFTTVRGRRSTYVDGKVAHGRTLIDELPYARDEVVMVGDTLRDLETARAMGVDCVLIDGGSQSAARLRGSGAPVLGRLAEVISVLDPSRSPA